MSEITYDEITSQLQAFSAITEADSIAPAAVATLVQNVLTYLEQSKAADDARHNSLITSINSLLGRLTTAEGAITSEASNRAAADTALGTRIDNEKAAREEAVSDLDSWLHDEEQRRSEADTALGERIDGEKGAREAADTALGERIDSEKGAREEAVSDLDSWLHDEEQRRSEADTALGSRIDSEKGAREGADTALGERISAAEGRLSSAEGEAADVRSRVSELEELPHCVWPFAGFAGSVGSMPADDEVYWIPEEGLFYKKRAEGSHLVMMAGTPYNVSGAHMTTTANTDGVFFYGGRLWHVGASGSLVAMTDEAALAALAPVEVASEEELERMAAAGELTEGRIYYVPEEEAAS